MGALALAADVTDPDALAQAFSAATEAHGPIEVLVASAGINRESLAAAPPPRCGTRSSPPI